MCERVPSHEGARLSARADDSARQYVREDMRDRPRRESRSGLPHRMPHRRSVLRRSGPVPMRSDFLTGVSIALLVILVGIVFTISALGSR